MNPTEFWEWYASTTKSAGKVVNERTALCVATVYGCVRLIGGMISTLPIHVYRNTADGKQKVRDSAIERFLNVDAFANWSASSFWHYVMMSLLLQGDAFARIHRPNQVSPAVLGLEPIHPSRVTVEREGPRLKYILNWPYRTPERVDQDDVLHFPGPMYDGERGMSQLAYALRNSVGIALAADEYSAYFFSNGARPDFALTTEKNLSPEAVSTLRETWAARHGGSAHAHLPAVLVGGLKVEPITINANDAQLIATRQFQAEDIASVYGVPLVLLGRTSTQTGWGTGIEQLAIGFVKYTLQPHLTVLEQEINRKIFRTGVSKFTGDQFAEFVIEGLLRGDSAARANYYRAALGGSAGPGWMTKNEVRRRENLPPIEGGDEIAHWKESTGEDRDDGRAQRSAA